MFRAEHDDSFDFWKSSEPRWKLCLVFNAVPPSAPDDIHYFLTTSKVASFRERPSLLSDVLILPAGTYPFFPQETLIDFRSLHVVPFPKLLSKGLRVLGELTPSDIAACESTAGTARTLENRWKKLLRLR